MDRVSGRWLAAGGLAAVLVGAALAALLAYATPHGMGVGGDSTVYISAARRLAAGHGLTFLDNVGNPQALTQFPPLYPLLLAAGERLGIGTLSTGHMLALFSFGLAGAATSWLCFLRTRSVLFALAGGAVVACISQLAHVHAQYMTEGPFIGMTMLALVLVVGYQTRDAKARAWPWLVGLGLVLVAAILFRFAAMSLAIAVAGAMLLSVRPGWRGRIAGFAVAVASAVAAMGLLALRNRVLGAPPAGRNTGYVPLTAQWIDSFLLTLSGAIMPHEDWRLLGNAVVLLLGLAFVVLPVLRLLGRRPGHVGGDVGRAVDRACWTFVLVYYPFLIACRMFVDAAIPSTYRLLAPGYMPMIVLVIGTLGDALLDRDFGRRLSARHFELPVLRWLPAAAAAALLWIGGQQTLAWVQGGRVHGFGYMSPRWQASPTLAAVESLPPETLIYSDGADAIGFLLGRESNGLPLVTFRTSGKPNPMLAEDLDRMRKTLEEHNGVVVYFKTIRRGDFLLGEEAAVEAFDLELVGEYDDGRIWRANANVAASE